MRQTKILYLNHVSYIGGAEIALLNLLTYLDRETFLPVALVPNGDLTEAICQLKIRCRSIPALDGLNRYNLPRFLAMLPPLLTRISEEQPALIHANTNFTSEYAGAIHRFTRIPTVAHIRDIEPFGRMGRWTIRQNTSVLAISDAVKTYLLGEKVPAQKIVRVYDGVDLHQYQPQSSSSHPNVLIGIVGQVAPRKGHLYLLEAIRELVKTCPNIQLWIVGKEPVNSTEGYTERLRQYVQGNHLEHDVKFWGFRTDISEILAQLDIVVLPSLQEPFGKIVIEAMAMQKPVVASSVGGVPEIVEHGKTGLLVPPADVKALRNALEQLITQKAQRAQMGHAGRQRVTQHFSLAENVRRTEHVYKDIAVQFMNNPG